MTKEYFRVDQFLEDLLAIRPDKSIIAKVYSKASLIDVIFKVYSPDLINQNDYEINNVLLDLAFKFDTSFEMITRFGLSNISYPINSKYIPFGLLETDPIVINKKTYGIESLNPYNNFNKCFDIAKDSNHFLNVLLELAKFDSPVRENASELKEYRYMKANLVTELAGGLKFKSFYFSNYFYLDDYIQI